MSEADIMADQSRQRAVRGALTVDEVCGAPSDQREVSGKLQNTKLEQKA